MKNWILTRVLKAVGKRFDGHKTKIGGAGLILLGLVHVIALAFPDVELPKASFEQTMLELSGGFTILGLGGKAEKIKTAVEKGGKKK